MQADGDHFLQEVDITHCVTGLARLGLLEADWSVGPPETAKTPFGFGIKVQPSPPGMELYGWALGIAGLQPAAFHSATLDPMEFPLLELLTASLPDLPPPPGTPAGE